MTFNWWKHGTYELFIEQSKWRKKLFIHHLKSLMTLSKDIWLELLRTLKNWPFFVNTLEMFEHAEKQLVLLMIPSWFFLTPLVLIPHYLAFAVHMQILESTLVESIIILKRAFKDKIVELWGSMLKAKQGTSFMLIQR